MPARNEKLVLENYILPRHDSTYANGSISVGAMKHHIKLEQLDGQEVCAKVTALGRKALVTLQSVPSLTNTLLTWENRRFRIERVKELGTDQMRLECTEV